MTGFLGVVHHRGRPPGGRTVDKAAARLAPGGDILAWRDGPVAIGWRGTEAHVHAGSDVVVMVRGWFEDPDAPEGDHGRPRETTAAALHTLWQRRGVDLATRLEGEFAAAIVDLDGGTVHLLGDPLGTRPLVWTRAPGRVAFSTDLPALLELPWVDRTLARDHLGEYLAFRSVHPPRTLLRDVQAVPAGHRLRLDPEGARLVRVHHPVYAAADSPGPPEAEVVGALQEAVGRAVRRRLLGGARVGVYLSGGTGSTAILAAARAAARDLRTWTVTVSDEPSPESPFAGRVASLLGMEHHTVQVGTRAIAEHFDDAVAALGHPIGNVAAVLQLLLAQAAAEHVDTVLTGDGTDQLFGGRMLREPAAAIAAAERVARVPWAVRSGLARALAPLGRGARLRVSPDEVARREGFGGVFLMDTADRRRLLLDDAAVRPDVRADVLAPYGDEVRTDRLNRILHTAFRSTLAADTLPRVERTAAAAGLSVGFPLLDAEVRRLAWLLPGAFKLRGLDSADLPTRWLLRAVLPTQLPSALVNRPDRGLPRPLEGWLGGSGRLFFEERFARLKDDPLDLWHATELEAMRRRLPRAPGTAHKLWALFVLDSWMRSHRVT